MVPICSSMCFLISCISLIFKVYLDVPYATDPEIIFPVVIIPAGQYCIPQQSQVDSYARPNMRELIRTGPSFQPALVPFPHAAAATAFGPPLNLYPSVYTRPANPEEPPPSYTEIFPDSNPSASGFNPTPLPFSPPPYTTMDSSPAHHYHTPQCPTPEYPSATGYWQSTANPESYSTK